MTADIERKVIKLAMLGDSSVGKTSICYVYVNLEFEEKLVSTIGQDKIESSIKMEDGKDMKLIIWDTAGQERFHSIAIKACRKAQGIIVVFDVTNRNSFLNVVNWLKEINENFLSPAIVLFGNKCDLTDRQVTVEEAVDFAKKNNIIYFETSAKNKININEGIEKIANDAYKRFVNVKPGITLTNNNVQKKRKCCGGGDEKNQKKDK